MMLGGDFRPKCRPKVSVWCIAGLTPEQMRQAFARDCGGLRFREPCLTQEILKFGKGREIAVLQAGLHASDKRTAICREIHDRHFPKLQLFKQVEDRKSTRLNSSH